MIDTRLYNENLVETYSTTKHKLLQVETNTLYSSSCVDLIEDYYPDGKPYSRFTYAETEEADDLADISVCSNEQNAEEAE